MTACMRYNIFSALKDNLFSVLDLYTVNFENGVSAWQSFKIHYNTFIYFEVKQFV